ncbi:MAG: DUF417 family protein, partial [Chthoniobacterales bacterium]|nr:DUF417 family protein [Chthoniobacterales bacterium]
MKRLPHPNRLRMTSDNICHIKSQRGRGGREFGDTLGILIALRFVAPMLSAVGSVGAIIMGLITLSFLLTTPGVW